MVASCKVASCKVTSCKVASCKVASCKVASCTGIELTVLAMPKSPAAIAWSPVYNPRIFLTVILTVLATPTARIESCTFQ
jgi:hypothetical protein